MRRLFFGPFLPSPLVKPGRLPVVPHIPGAIAQVVHSHDVGEAYRLAATGDARGAFNVAAEPELDGSGSRRDRARGADDPAAGGARSRRATWRLRLQPTSPDWLDLALGVPLLDCTRAREELGWAPRTTGLATIRELLLARRRAGGRTPPLRAGGAAPSSRPASAGNPSEQASSRPAAYFKEMSKLPRTHDLPRRGEGYDPARVEEAFAAFADRVRELEAVAAELRAELRSLRAERAGAAASRRGALARSSRARTCRPTGSRPCRRRSRAELAVPRLALEGAFLLLVALLAGLADLSAGWIVLVMVAAWALVVLSEWAAAAKRARWRLDEIAPPLAAAAADTTGPWDMPVVEATVVEAGPDPESKTIVTTLPAERAGGGARRAPEPAPRRAGAAAACGAAGSRPRRGPPIPGRRDLLAAAVAAALVALLAAAVPDAACRRARAEALLRPRRRGLRDGPEAADRARVRPRRPALRDPGDGRGRRRRPRLVEAPRARPGLRDAARPRPGSARRSTSRRRATSAGSSCVGRRRLAAEDRDAAAVRPAPAGHDRGSAPTAASTSAAARPATSAGRRRPAQRRDPLLPPGRSDLRVVARGPAQPVRARLRRARRSTSPTTPATTSARPEPAETIVRIRQGADYGWPRCWASWRLRRLQGSCRGVTPPSPTSSRTPRRTRSRSGAGRWSWPSGVST